jgi:hypothetical protein
VLIAIFDCAHQDFGWAHDEVIGSHPLVPGVDLCIEDEHIFETEREAIAFVRNWWISAKMSDYEFFMKRVKNEPKDA